MDMLNSLLGHPHVLRLGWSLAHFIWQGAVLAILLVVVLHLLRRRSANARYLAATATLVLMALALPATTWLIPSPSPNVDVPPQALPKVEGSAVEVDSPDEGLPAPFDASQLLAVLSHAAAADDVPMEAAAQHPLPPAPPRSERLLESANQWMPWVAAVWLVGVVILSLRLTAGWVMVQRLKRRYVEPAGRQCEEIVQKLAARLSVIRPVRIVRSACAQVPSTVGWFRPLILLPASALTGMSREQLEAIIAHELAHIRRHDYLVNLLQSVVETLLFYHPAVWWVSRRMRVEREHCCDDLAIAVCGNRVAYARALSELESLRGTPTLLAAASGGSLIERVQRILGMSAPAANPFARCTAGVLVGAIAVSFFAAVELSSSLAQAQENPALPSPATAPAEPDQRAEVMAINAQPHYWHHYVKLVVGENVMTFQGEPVTWEELDQRIEALPDRMNTTFMDGYETRNRPEGASERLRQLLRKYEFAEHTSYNAPLELGSKGPPSEYLPHPTVRGRWKHYARLVLGDPPHFNGRPLGDLSEWTQRADGLPAPYWTTLEVALAPGALTSREYERAKEQIRRDAARIGLEGLADVGEQLPDSPPSSPQFLADPHQPGRWEHYVQLVVGDDRITWQGKDVLPEDLPDLISGLPDKQNTVFYFNAFTERGLAEEIRGGILDLLRKHQFNTSLISDYQTGFESELKPSIFIAALPAGNADEALQVRPTSRPASDVIPANPSSRPADGSGGLAGHVLESGGEPAAGATVVLVGPGRLPVLSA